MTLNSRILQFLAVAAVCHTGGSMATASSPLHPATAAERRLDGVLSRLFDYQHGRPAVAYPAPPGAAAYGTPSSPYRWGWFGARHAGPRTHTHRGFDDDYWSWQTGRRK